MESVCLQLNVVMLKMKMADVSAVTVLLLLSSFFTTADSLDVCDLYAETKKNIHLPLHHNLKSSEQLRWVYNKTVIFDRRGNELLRGRQEDVSKNGSLFVRNVDKTKEGKYTPSVFDNGIAKGELKSLHLCVQDPVSMPQMKILCLKDNVQFTCTTDQMPKGVTIEWLQNDKVMKGVKGQFLPTKALKDVEKDTFSCRVSNKVSTMASRPVKQNCTVPVFVFPTKLFGISTWIFVGIGGGFVLLLIMFIIICCVRNMRKRKMQVKEEEELRLGWTKTNQQQHHQRHGHHPDHHHRHQQQPAGHTGPRQHRSKQQCTQKAQDPENANSHPQPNPRRAAQGTRPVNDGEQPPPLPQPRKKAARATRA